MKKCPYCAEEIQDEAIVCRYCGRDLLATKPETAVQRDQPVQDNKPSAWKQGAKASAVLTALYLIGRLLTPQYLPELIGDLTIGLIVTFLGWWIISAGIVWAWRKMGAVGFS